VIFDAGVKVPSALSSKEPVPPVATRTASFGALRPTSCSRTLTVAFDALPTVHALAEAAWAIGVVVGVVAAVLAAGAGAAVVPQVTATSERIRSVSALLMCRTLTERGSALY